MDLLGKELLEKIETCGLIEVHEDLEWTVKLVTTFITEELNIPIDKQYSRIGKGDDDKGCSIDIGYKVTDKLRQVATVVHDDSKPTQAVIVAGFANERFDEYLNNCFIKHNSIV